MISDREFTTENWTDQEGNHQGGQSWGPGFSISWQRGPLTRDGKTKQNGAFLITVLLACINQLQYFQDSKFKSKDNQEALDYLVKAVEALDRRKNTRQQENKLGTHKV